MRALVITGTRTLEVRTDYPEERAPTAGDVLIEVRAVGICGSDLHVFQTGSIGNIGIDPPYVQGHEFMGTVIDAPAGSRDGTGAPLALGTRVAVDPHVACGRCAQCEEGNPNLCPHHWFMGLPGNDGAMREHMLLPAQNCFTLPDSISDAAGALLEPLGVAIHTMDLAKPKAAAPVVVIGCGAIGLLIIRLARLAGMSPVIAIDPLSWRTAIAKEWGATDVATSRAEDAIEAVASMLPDGAPTVIEAAWAGPAIDAACRMAAPGGRVVLVGIPADDSCSLPHSVARRKGLTFRFVRRMKHTYPRAIALASGESPLVRLDALATHSAGLDGAARLFGLHSEYRDGLLRGIVVPRSH